MNTDSISFDIAGKHACFFSLRCGKVGILAKSRKLEVLLSFLCVDAGKSIRYFKVGRKEFI